MNKNYIVTLFFLLLTLSVLKAQPFNNFISLNGQTDYVEIPNNPAFHIQGDVTLEAWFRFPDMDIPINTPIFLNCIHPDNWGVFIGLGEEENGRKWANFSVVINHTQYDVRTITPLQPKTWYYLTGIREEDEIRIYLNGMLDSTLSIPFGDLRFGNGVNRIGHSQNEANDFYTGDIDEVRVWNIARTQDDITAAMNQELEGNEQGLVAYYKLNEIGSGEGIAVTNSASFLGSLAGGITFGTGNTPVFGTIVDIEKAYFNNEISISPNPTTNNLHVKLPVNTSYHLQVFNQYGLKVLDKLKTDDFENISSLPSGVYYATITLKNEQIITEKFIKL